MLRYLVVFMHGTGSIPLQSSCHIFTMWTFVRYCAQCCGAGVIIMIQFSAPASAPAPSYKLGILKSSQKSILKRKKYSISSEKSISKKHIYIQLIAPEPETVQEPEPEWSRNFLKGRSRSRKKQFRLRNTDCAFYMAVGTRIHQEPSMCLMYSYVLHSLYTYPAWHNTRTPRAGTYLIPYLATVRV